jgi:hypothetical protein
MHSRGRGNPSQPKYFHGNPYLGFCLTIHEMGKTTMLDIDDDIDFDIPDSIEGARDRKANLQDQIESIQYQLSKPDKKDDKGNRLPPEKYHKWRRQAVKALTAKKRELRFIKRWIRDRQKQRAAKMFDIDPNDESDLLIAANNLIQEKVKEGCEFTDAELLLANTIRDHVIGVS